MSGPVCPDCGSFDIDTKKGKDHCKLCNWSGDKLPRKIMSATMMRSHNDETNRKKKLKKKGQFFFVRIYFTGDDDELDEVEDQIFELLDPDGLTTSFEEPFYFYAETEVEPSKDVLAKIKKLNRVSKITVD